MRAKAATLTGFLCLLLTAGAGVANAAIPAGANYSSHPGGTVLPAALRPVFYRTLAKDAGAAYAIDKDGCATLTHPKLKACFNAGGAHFSGAGSPLALQLTAWGRGGKLAAVPAMNPAIEDDRVSYGHGNLEEWWRVLPVGFEQGFTIARRPGGSGELLLALTASGRANQHDGALGWGKLRYGRLVVTDGRGKVVPATLRSENDRIWIAVNDAHTAYPLTVDPLVWIEQKVAASDGTAIDRFGSAVAVSGATALVGAYVADLDGGYSQGAVYVFNESNGTWTQTQKLTASDGDSNDYFGTSVAISGGTALVGAIDAAANGNEYQGAVYVFNESGGTWTQTQKFTASDGETYDAFGTSVALDGATAVVGAYCAHYEPYHCGPGAAYVFTNSGGSWSQAAMLAASDGTAGDAFGASVALDGTTALVGAWGVGGGLQGAAYVFSDSGGTWTQTQKLTASDGAFLDNFGTSVGLAGNMALVGTPDATINDNVVQGAVYAFTNSGGTWAQTQKLTADDGAEEDQFGTSLAVAGATVLVGAPSFDANPGAAYVFSDSGGTWAQVQKLTADDGVDGDNFGDAVALDGDSFLVGSDDATVGGNDEQGAAYFYGQGDLGLAINAPETIGQGQQYVSETIVTNNANAVSPAVTATMAIPAAASFVSAVASQGSCSESAGVVACDFGPIAGNAGAASADVTLEATGDVGTTIENTASVTGASPPLTAAAPTQIGQADCPHGYSKHSGTLNPHQLARMSPYQAPAGEENAILTAPNGFQLYMAVHDAKGKMVERIPGNQMHQQMPAGTFVWGVKAGGAGGPYTLCILHP